MNSKLAAIIVALTVTLSPAAATITPVAAAVVPPAAQSARPAFLCLPPWNLFITVCA